MNGVRERSEMGEWWENGRIGCLVVREKSSVGSECAQLTNHSVGRPMYYIDEASGGVLRERDSQVTGFHSSHSSRNLWSHWKWNEWIPVCLKR